MAESTPLAPHSPERAPSRTERAESLDSVAEACRLVAAATSSDLSRVPPLPQTANMAAAMAAGGGAALLAAGDEQPVSAVVPGLTVPAGATRVGSGSSASRASSSSPFASPSRPIILGVGGASGSGKTSMNRILSASLPGLRVASISGDNYYIPLGEGVDPATYNFDTPSAIDFKLLAVHLRQLRDGRPADVPQYDFATHSRLPETTRVDGVHVIIVDGIFTLAIPFIRELCDFTIFTLEDMDVCLARRLKRDIAQRGRTVDDVLEQYERFVKPGYHMYVAPTMRHANLIVPRGEPCLEPQTRPAPCPSPPVPRPGAPHRPPRPTPPCAAARDNTETLAMLVEYLRHRVQALNPELPEGAISAAATGIRRASLFDPDE